MGGRHSFGGESLLDRFDAAVTAIKWSGSAVWFANCARRLPSHAYAPERHASASGTMWSTSSLDGSVTVTPS